MQIQNNMSLNKNDFTSLIHTYDVLCRMCYNKIVYDRLS